MADGLAIAIQYDSSNGPTQDSSATATLTSYKYWPDLDWRLCNYSKNCCLSLRQPQDMAGAERTWGLPGAGLVGRRFSSNNPLTKNLINWNLSVNELPLPLPSPFPDPHIYRLVATDPGRRQQKRIENRNRQCPHRPGISNINAAYASRLNRCQLSWGEKLFVIVRIYRVFRAQEFCMSSEVFNLKRVHIHVT